jgi:hypothetical protein
VSLNPFSKKKSLPYDFEEEEQIENERKVRERLEREEQKFAKEQKKIDLELKQAEESRRKVEARQLEIDEQRRRFIEEEERRKAKKETAQSAKAGNASPPTASPPHEPELVVLPDDQLENSTEKIRESLLLTTTESLDETSDVRPEPTEHVVQPIIGKEPSTAFKTSWSNTNRPWHGLSMNGYAGDVHCDAGTFGKIASIGGTLRGFKHQVPDRSTGAAGQNEDWFSTFCAVSFVGVKYVVSVVCDGLSSAAYSWYGARRTSTSLARDVASAIGQLSEVNAELLQSVVDNSLANQANTLMTWNPDEYGAPQIDPKDIDPNALGCTVTLAVVCADPNENGSHSVVAGNVGDSPVFSLSNGKWRKISPPDLDGGDILDTKTQAFPRHTQCFLVDDQLRQGECVLMTSDGVGNFILRNGTTLALGNYLSTRWNAPVGILTFLNQLNFDLPTADDDRTAVAFWPA